MTAMQWIATFLYFAVFTLLFVALILYIWITISDYRKRSKAEQQQRKQEGKT